MKALRIPTIILLILVGGGCGKNLEQKVLDAAVSQADRLTPTPTASQPEVPSVRQKVYIDASISMRGFVTPDTPGGLTQFIDFIETMPDVLPGCEVYQYGVQPQKQSGGTVEGVTKRVEFDSQLRKPGFYSLKFNPDDVLLKGIAGENEPTLSVLITDGVESDSEGKINTAVLESIRSWMNEGKLFSILVLKSNFAGGFYSERRRHMVGDANVKDRPFYAFVFSTSRREFEDFYEKLRRRFGQMEAIIFSDDALSCKVALPSEIEASYDTKSPADSPYYLQMLVLKKLRQEEEAPGYRFTYSTKPTYPVKSFGLRLNVSLYEWDDAQGQFQRQGTALPGNINYKESSDKPGDAGNEAAQSFVVDSREMIQIGQQRNFGLFAVQPSLYIKDISDGIVQLSTRDDSTPTSANKTYRFQELVFALLDIHMKDRLDSRASPKVYVTIFNR